MPLIVIVGLPGGGKSTRATELQEFFIEKGKQVHLITDNIIVPKMGFKKNEYLTCSESEKIVRSELKSEALRLLNKEDVVILDACNYIKGYRYELFCATKAARSTQCTILCGTQNHIAWEFNLKRVDEDTTDLPTADENALPNNSNIPYTLETFDAVCMRFEDPNGNNRWDSPLFVAFPDDTLDFNAIYTALFESKPLVPNMSTQNPPLASGNYLFELDRITKEIVGDILASRKIGLTGAMSVKGSQVKVDIPINMTPMQLHRVRRQFLNYSKLQHTTSSTLEVIPQLFVQFLNSNCRVQ